MSRGVYQPAQDVVDNVVRAVKAYISAEGKIPYNVWMSPRDLSDYNKGCYGHCAQPDFSAIDGIYDANHSLAMHSSHLLKPGDIWFVEPGVSPDGSHVY